MYGDSFITIFKGNIAEMFKRGERDKNAKMTAQIIQVNLHRRYPYYFALPQESDIKSYVGHMMNKKPSRAIIEFDYRIYSSRRRGRKELCREKYYDKLKICFRENFLGFNPFWDVLCLKNK